MGISIPPNAKDVNAHTEDWATRGRGCRPSAVPSTPRRTSGRLPSPDAPASPSTARRSCANSTPTCFADAFGSDAFTVTTCPTVSSRDARPRALSQPCAARRPPVRWRDVRELESTCSLERSCSGVPFSGTPRQRARSYAPILNGVATAPSRRERSGMSVGPWATSRCCRSAGCCGRRTTPRASTGRRSAPWPRRMGARSAPSRRTACCSCRPDAIVARASPRRGACPLAGRLQRPPRVGSSTAASPAAPDSQRCRWASASSTERDRRTPRGARRRVPNACESDEAAHGVARARRGGCALVAGAMRHARPCRS